MANFPTAATVYDTDGRKLYFRRDLGDGTAIVSRWLSTEGWDGETEEYVSDEPIIKSTDRLFASPPTEVLAEEVANLSSAIHAARQALAFVQHETRDAKAERARFMATLTAAEPLRNVERFIAGEITHFVMVDASYSGELYGNVSVLTFEQALTYHDDNGRPQGMKLLSLYGDSKGDLSWRISHYSDGSGSNKLVYPFLNEADARAKAAELMDVLWDGHRTGHNRYRLDASIKSAALLGLEVPADVLKDYNEAAIATHEKAVADAEEKASVARAALAKARGEA